MGSILVVNAGSTSLKLSVVAEDGTAERVESLADPAATAVEAVAHRVVHGGERFAGPVVVDEGVLQAIHARGRMAPPR